MVASDTLSLANEMMLLSIDQGNSILDALIIRKEMQEYGHYDYEEYDDPNDPNQ